MCALCAQKQQDLTAYVNTMQGLHNTPGIFPTAAARSLVALPQGVNSWSPVGFSYVGRSAAGVGGCGIVLRPLTEAPSPETATATVDTASIVGRPHYFRMRTSDGILSEMSPTERCAVFRFTYLRRSEALLALSGEEMDGVEADAAARCVTGYVIRRSNVSQAADKTWFLLRFDRDFTVDEDRKGGTLLLRFGRGGTVGVQAAVSKIDARQARVTFGRELEGNASGRSARRPGSAGTECSAGSRSRAARRSSDAPSTPASSGRCCARRRTTKRTPKAANASPTTARCTRGAITSIRFCGTPTARSSRCTTSSTAPRRSGTCSRSCAPRNSPGGGPRGT